MKKTKVYEVEVKCFWDDEGVFNKALTNKKSSYTFKTDATFSEIEKETELYLKQEIGRGNKEPVDIEIKSYVECCSFYPSAKAED